jgi:phenylacetate-CoA ligase
MSRIRGRIDDMIIMGAVKVFPSQIEQILLGVEGLQPAYEIVVDRVEGVDSLEVRVEAIDEGRERIRARIIHEIAATLDVTAEVTLVAPRSIQRHTEGKVRHVIDRRQGS